MLNLAETKNARGLTTPRVNLLPNKMIVQAGKINDLAKHTRGERMNLV
jgi:hypothetical protein